MPEEFPSNSRRSRTSATAEEKKVEQVTTSTATRRKKPLGKQFKETFIGGDAKTAAHHMVFEVLIPSAKAAVVEALEDGIRGLILGDTRRRSAAPRPGGPVGSHISYNRFSAASPKPSEPRTISKQARAQFDFDEIFLSDRNEAQEVIDQMFELVSRFESASVADLYSLVGLSSAHTDHNWGWTNLYGAGVARVRGGFLLDLPKPEPLN